MIRTKEQKQNVVTGLVTRLRRSPTVYVTDFTGLNVAKLTDLRRKLMQYIRAHNKTCRPFRWSYSTPGHRIRASGT